MTFMLSIKGLKSKQVCITINLPINGTHSSRSYLLKTEFTFIGYYDLFTHNN